jgi:hypothetical protein
VRSRGPVVDTSLSRQGEASRISTVDRQQEESSAFARLHNLLSLEMGSHQLALCLVPAVPVGIQLCGGMTQLHTARRSPVFGVRGGNGEGQPQLRDGWPIAAM